MSDRISRLAEQLRADGIDAFFASSAITMGYLHGLFEDGHERFFTMAISAKGDVRLICPALSVNQAKRAGVADVVGWRDGEDPLALFHALANDWSFNSGTLAVDDEMPAQMLLKMQGALPGARFRAGQETLSRLMRRKDSGELGHLRAAAKIADEAYPAAIAQIRAGMTERQIDRILRSEMEARGGVPTFCIVAAGAGSAEPHHLSMDVPVKSGDVLVLDFGCSVAGYQSDITRTVVVGEPTAKQREVYDVVLRAHHAGRAAGAAGRTGAEVDAAARAVIDDAGYGEYFVHRTGHGIGMRGHEEPYIVSTNHEPLEAGNCFSVEPGIYLPGEFGVRIENIVVAATGASESLNAEPAATLESVG